MSGSSCIIRSDFHPQSPAYSVFFYKNSTSPLSYYCCFLVMGCWPKEALSFTESWGLNELVSATACSGVGKDMVPHPCCWPYSAPQVQAVPGGFPSPFSGKNKKMSLHIIFPLLLTLKHYWKTPLNIFQAMCLSKFSEGKIPPQWRARMHSELMIGDRWLRAGRSDITGHFICIFFIAERLSAIILF